MIALRARQPTKRRTVLDPLFPECAEPCSDLGSPSALAVLARWPAPAALAQARPSAVTRVLHAARRGPLGAETARARRPCAATSVGGVAPFGAAAIAAQPLVAHLEPLRAPGAEFGERLDALHAEDAPVRALLASIPGFGRETIRTGGAERPPMARFAEQAREQTRIRTKPKYGAEKLGAAGGLDAQVTQSGRSAGRAHRRTRGNRSVRRAVMLAARAAARTALQCRAIYDAQRARGKPSLVARSHGAHQLLHIAYSVLLHAKPSELPIRFAAVDEPQLATAGA